MRSLGMSGFPSAALVDPAGTVVWKGHPGSLQPSVIEEYLGGALTKPMWEWPAAAKGVKKALVKRQFAKALAAAEKLKADDELAGVVRGMIAGRAKGLEAFRDRGDYLGLQDLASTLKKELAGLPEGDTAAGVLKDLKADKDAQLTIKGQKEVAKLKLEADELKKRKDLDKLTDKLKKVMAKYPDTYAQAQAKGLIEELMAKRPKLR